MRRDQQVLGRFAVLVRDAVTRLAARVFRRATVRSLGAGRSGRGDISERADELLAGLFRGR
jgi:hypothetical protein